MCFNKFLTMFFRFSAEIVCINVAHQKTQRQKSSQSEIVLTANFWFDYNFLGYDKTAVDRGGMRQTDG